MSQVHILLLGPEGVFARVALADDISLSAQRKTITRSLGLPDGSDLTIRKYDGSPVDQRAPFASSGARTDDRLLVEVRTAARSGLLGRFGRQRSAADATVVPSAYRVLPCYLAVDTSASMRGEPIGQVNHELPRLRAKMLREPELAEVCQLSVVTFDETAAVHAPLTDIADMQLPGLTAEGRGTNYAYVFELLRTTIAADLYELYRTGRRPYRPVVFFLSDGQHNRADDWLAPLDRLTDRSAFYGAPNVVAFGFGEATAETIQVVGRKAAYMPEEGAPSAKLDTFMTFLLSSLTNSMSGGRHDRDDVFVVPPAAPTGWRAIKIQR
ncbi:vWA domain-containing protein [Actinoplanes sp. CA-252034]|uniref:vWA domain-containing protein n=1 Tax=Actinoplanes sp. CA-252034 TaxID=3239906 RepID=UPI003D95DD27